MRMAAASRRFGACARADRRCDATQSDVLGHGRPRKQTILLIHILPGHGIRLSLKRAAQSGNEVESVVFRSQTADYGDEFPLQNAEREFANYLDFVEETETSVSSRHPVIEEVAYLS